MARYASRVLALWVLMTLLTLGAGAVSAATFSPLDDASNDFSRLMHNSVARTVVFLGVAAVGFAVVLMRGHGIEIFVVAFVIVAGLVFMIAGPDYVFELAGFTDI